MLKNRKVDPIQLELDEYEGSSSSDEECDDKIVPINEQFHKEEYKDLGKDEFLWNCPCNCYGFLLKGKDFVPRGPLTKVSDYCLTEKQFNKLLDYLEFRKITVLAKSGIIDTIEFVSSCTRYASWFFAFSDIISEEEYNCHLVFCELERDNKVHIVYNNLSNEELSFGEAKFTICEINIIDAMIFDSIAEGISIGKLNNFIGSNIYKTPHNIHFKFV